MYAIRHRFGIKASADKVFQLLTTDEGLKGWWTKDVTGAGDTGSVIQFRFNGNGPDFKVTELTPGKRVRWQYSGGVPEEWQGTEIVFDLQEDGDKTRIDFSHANWKEASNLAAHCNMKWAVFLLSLKQLAETGTGRAFPNDIQIED
ncbi:SRPBCC family protein [Kangiella shandongensis]|uniref:SRPBCC family protein n=1 Tax=Kangiella shandongensis TaxID=2763258 RepID=UPI001CBE73DA|nr:SRPBCC domain-containing protein [Kangiella shandongensis]